MPGTASQTRPPPLRAGGRTWQHPHPPPRKPGSWRPSRSVPASGGPGRGGTDPVPRPGLCSSCRGASAVDIGFSGFGTVLRTERSRPMTGSHRPANGRGGNMLWALQGTALGWVMRELAGVSSIDAMGPARVPVRRRTRRRQSLPPALCTAATSSRATGRANRRRLPPLGTSLRRALSCTGSTGLHLREGAADVGEAYAVSPEPQAPGLVAPTPGSRKMRCR